MDWIANCSLWMDHKLSRVPIWQSNRTRLHEPFLIGQGHGNESDGPSHASFSQCPFDAPRTNSLTQTRISLISIKATKFVRRGVPVASLNPQSVVRRGVPQIPPGLQGVGRGRSEVHTRKRNEGGNTHLSKYMSGRFGLSY